MQLIMANLLVEEFQGIDNDDEPNFLFNQILYNKSKINKAKKISYKIGVLKFSTQNTPNISSKETLSNSDRSKLDNFNNIKKNYNDSVILSFIYIYRSLKELYFFNFNTNNVTTLNYMFSKCSDELKLKIEVNIRMFKKMPFVWINLIII